MGLWDSSSDSGVPDKNQLQRRDIYTLLSKTDFSKDSSCDAYVRRMSGYHKSVALGKQLLWHPDRYYEIIEHINLKYPGTFS
jgi:hypothetical protein